MILEKILVGVVVAGSTVPVFGQRVILTRRNGSGTSDEQSTFCTSDKIVSGSDTMVHVAELLCSVMALKIENITL